MEETSPTNEATVTLANDEAVVSGKEDNKEENNAIDVEMTESASEIERLTQERQDALVREKESHEQTQALIDALDLLTKLASMDNTLYSRTLSSSGSCSTVDSDPDKDVSAVQSRLDALQSKWKLEQTPVPALLRSIHRLQSNTSNLIKEADHQTLHMQSMEAYCAKQEKRQAKLEKAVHKLHEQNHKLREKLRSKKRERKSFVKSVKEYVNSVNLMKKKKEDLTIEEQRISNQLKAHERLLRLERAALDDGCSHNGGGGNRKRISTFDSLPESCGGNRSRGSTCDSYETYSDPDPQDVSSDISSVSGVSTGSSLITDEGVATIRYNGPRQASAQNMKSEDVAQDDHHPSLFGAFGGFKPFEKPSADYSLTFQTDTKIGLQFHKVPVEKEKPRTGLLTEAFLVDSITPNASNVKNDSEKNSPKSDVKTKKPLTPPRGLSKHFTFDSILGRSNKEKDAVEKAIRQTMSKDDESTTSHPEDGDQVAFLVCGFSGFDSQQNIHPKVGARLVAVDQLSLESGKWTLSQVREMIKARGSRAASDDSTSTFTMTFRNEPLNKKQKEILQRAVKAAEEKQQPSPKKKKETENPLSDPTGKDNDTQFSVDETSDGEKKEEVASQVNGDNQQPTDSAAGGESPKTKESGKGEETEGTGGEKLVAPAQPGEKFKNSMKEMSSKFKSLF